MNKHILNKTKGKSLGIHSDNDFLFGIRISGCGFHPQLVLEGRSSSLLDHAGETSNN